MRHRLRTSFLTLLTLGAWLTCHPAQADTLLHYVGETGEFLGKGKEKTVDAAKGAQFTVTGDPRYLLFQVQDGKVPRPKTYTVGFAVPARGSLTVGDYPGATLYAGFYQSAGPGLTFTSNGAGATRTLTGRFTVLEANFDANHQVVSFAANFVLNADDRAAAVYGELRYNSSVPYTTPAGVADFASNNYRALSTSGQQMVTIVRRGSTNGLLSVDYTTADGTDLAGRDYTPVAGSLTWTDGETADKTITVPILRSPDPLQGNGSFAVNLSGPAAGTQNQTTVTVVNDDSAVTFIHFQSDPGDPIGEGLETTLNLDGGFLLTPGHGYYGQNLSFDVTTANGIKYPEADEYRLDLYDGAGINPSIGSYQATGQYPTIKTGVPVLSFFQYGEGVGKLTGNFQVLEAEYDTDGSLLKFAANFEQHDQGNGAGLYGQVRYHSTVPLPAPRITQVGVAAKVATTYDYVGNTPGVFILTRTGSLALPLTVGYKVGGDAVPRQDYVPLEGQCTIKAGSATAKVKVRAIHIDQAGSSPPVNVTLKIVPRTDVYGAASTQHAKVQVIHWGH